MSVTGMKQGWKGCGRKKASRGRENLKAQRSRGMQARRESLPASSSAEGQENPRGGPSGKANDERVSAKEDAGTDKSSRVKLWTRSQRQERRRRCVSGDLGQKDAKTTRSSSCKHRDEARGGSTKRYGGQVRCLKTLESS